MSDIFISYANHDRERIGPLVEALEARGWSVFWDTTLLPGETWHSKIAGELEAAKCVVVLWSASSIKSHWVFEEAGEGRQRGILVPATIDAVALPLGFRSLQAANLIGWNGEQENREFAKLLRGIAIYAPLLSAKAADGAAEGGKLEPVGATQALPGQKEDNLVTIPAGTFWMGAQKTDKSGRNYDPEAFDQESPVREVKLKSFRMARFPVTVQEFSGFLRADGYKTEKHWQAGGFGTTREPQGWAKQEKNPNWPVVGVNWFEASAYCAWMGLRLPKEAEWERAARGPQSARYPWGNEPALNQLCANYSRNVGHPSPEGRYPPGQSVEGIHDLLGNVWEWCSDWYGQDSRELKVLRGGSWYYNPQNVRVSYRSRSEPANRYNNIGFRCAGELR